MADYTIGIDFGTTGCRAVLVDCLDGSQVASAAAEYYNGVMQNNFINGLPLQGEWAIGHPQDYIDVICEAVSSLVNKTGIRQVRGIGLAFSSCSCLPVKADGTPLCLLPRFKEQPHAYIKVTRHRTAVEQGRKIGALAKEMKEPWVEIGQNAQSPEWMLPKIFETLEKAPEVYYEADYFMEAVDWLVWQLTGCMWHNSFSASFKAQIYDDIKPSKAFLKALHPALEQLYETKLNIPVKSPCSCAGGLTEDMAKAMGLVPGTPVAVGSADIPACVPALGAVSEGCLTAVLGKMASLITLSNRAVMVEGVARGIKGTVLPGLYTYKSNQPCMGDNYAWFLNNFVAPEYHNGAKEEGRNLHSFVARKMIELKPGESGIISLNWLKGSLAPVNNSGLTGMFIGMDTSTKPEHIYRAIIEGMAFDTLMVVEAYKKMGIGIGCFYGVGTIAERNPFIMQLYADILNMPVKVAGSDKSSALGAAIYGAAAGGVYRDVFEAAENMASVKDTVYVPQREAAMVYAGLYGHYRELVNFFTGEGREIMPALRAMRG